MLSRTHGRHAICAHTRPLFRQGTGPLAMGGRMEATSRRHLLKSADGGPTPTAVVAYSAVDYCEVDDRVITR